MGGDARRGGGARGVVVPGEPWTGVCAHGGDVWRAAEGSTSFSAYRRGVRAGTSSHDGARVERWV